MISFFEILDPISTACNDFGNFLEMKRDLEDLRKFACMGYEWVRLVYNSGNEKMWVLEKHKNVDGIVDFDSENYIVVGYSLGKLIDIVVKGKDMGE